MSRFQNRMVLEIKEEIDNIILVSVVAQQMFCRFKSFLQKTGARIRRNWNSNSVTSTSASIFQCYTLTYCIFKDRLWAGIWNLVQFQHSS